MARIMMRNFQKQRLLKFLQVTFQPSQTEVLKTKQ